MFKKRTLLALTLSLMLIITSSLLMVPAAYSQFGLNTQVPLPGSAIPQFVDRLPMLHTIFAGNNQIELQMTEFQSNVMPSTFVPATGTYTGTWVWSYLDPSSQLPANPTTSYIGPVIVATRGNATEIKYVNNLGNSSTTNVLAYKYATDQSLHWANPFREPLTMGNLSHYDGPIPAVPHLHGGEVPPVLDGGPDAWFTSDGNYVGEAYYSKGNDTSSKNYAIYRYPNTQEAASLWFHDHTLGATRLNVYAGLAGAYILVDPALSLPANLPGPTETVPLVIQDRMFDTNGQLYFPNIGINPEHPYWLPEFVGDTIVVNGKVWPYLDVQPQRYRFLVLNGSNARPYELSLGAPMWVIGTDGGYLDTPAPIPAGQKLVVMPGERYDVIIDFAGLQGQSLILKNSARTPYPFGAPPQGSTVGRIMQFRVRIGTVVDNSYNPALGTPLRIGSQKIKRLVNPATGKLAAGVIGNNTRELTLNEVMGMGGPLEVLVNNSKWGGMRMNPGNGTMEPIPGAVPDGFGNYLTELPKEGDTEVWEIVNLTADAHPIHLHLVQFQLINRQNFNTNKYNKVYNAQFPASVQIDPMTGLTYPGGVFIGGFGPPLDYDKNLNLLSGGKYGGNPDITPYLQGPVRPPAAYEAGWKDTVIMYPGQVTRIAVRWAPTDKAINGADMYYPFDPNAGGRDYVWHCHIIDHEDNEMMRPDQVMPKLGATRTYDFIIDY